MKSITRNWFGLVVGCALVCCLPSQGLAIEGLKLKIVSTNVVLSWPSDPSETYLIQYRHTLSATDSWTTLADYYPPVYSGTNITYFYDTQIDYGTEDVGGSGSGGIPVVPSSLMDTKSIDLSSSTQIPDAIIEIITPPPLRAQMGLPTVTTIESLVTSDGVTPMGSTGGTSTNQTIPGTGFYRVVRDGIHLVGISNDMVLSGVVKIPIELGNASGQIVSTCISEDESPVGNSIQCPVSNPYFITLDTTQMTNGVHQINGSARWEDTNGNDWEVDSPTLTVTTSNEVTFENWMPAFGQLGNTLLIRATSAHPVTEWEIDVYGSTNNYIGSFIGDTTNGDIGVVWDLVDYYGVQHTNDNFFNFYITTDYAGPKTPKTYKQTDPWAGTGRWVFGVQHAFDNLMDVETLYEELNGFLGAAQVNGGVSPTPINGNPFDIHFQDTQEASSWYQFRLALFDPLARNVCYFGHGGPNGLGYNQHSTNQSVTVADISNILHTLPVGQTNRHAYRFAFLDGCSTAKGTLPEAFGILHKEGVTGPDYYNASVRPSAFVGWTADKWIGFQLGNSINYDHVNFIVFIQQNMLLNGATISAAKVNAANQIPPGSFVITSQLKIFGYGDLTLGAFNN
jgi:hypothetical protein